MITAMNILMILSSMLDASLKLSFYNTVLLPEGSKWVHKKWICFVVCSAALSSVMSILQVFYLIKFAIVFVGEIIFCYLVSEHKRCVSLCLPALANALMYICESTVPLTLSALFKIPVTVVADTPFFMVYGILESRGLMYLVLGGTLFFLHRKRSVPDTRHLRAPQLICLSAGAALLGGSATALSYVLNNTGDVGYFLKVLPIVLFVLLVLITVLFISLSRETERKYRLESEAMQQENLQRQRQALTAMYENILGMRHDLKNHLRTLAGLLEQGESGQALEYVKQISDTAEGAGVWVNTGNAAIDSLLHAKLSSAREAGIGVRVNLSLPDTNEVKTSDLCTVLFNVLDNAIEACERNADPKNRWLRLIVAQQKYRLVVFCENPSENEPLEGKNGFKSAKSGLLHGIGLTQVRRVADKYNGMCGAEYHKDTGTFRITVLLPNECGETINISVIEPEKE